MKPLTFGAGHLWVLMSPWRMDVKWHMKCSLDFKSTFQYMKHFICHFTYKIKQNKSILVNVPDNGLVDFNAGESCRETFSKIYSQTEKRICDHCKFTQTLIVNCWHTWKDWWIAEGVRRAVGCTFEIFYHL